MNWKRAIEINRENLASIVAGLVAMVSCYAPSPGPSGRPLPKGARTPHGYQRHASSPLGEKCRAKRGDEGGLLAVAPIRLPPPTYRQILNILRPAEAALRRLIVVVATILNIRGVIGKARMVRRPLPDFSSFIRKAIPQFPLIDPRKIFTEEKEVTYVQSAGIPSVSIPGIFDPVFETRSYDDIDASSIIRRLAALDHALKTLPKQARRLARLMTKRDQAKPGRGRVGPIRPGKPPGFRQRHRHAVDDILDECHWLVREVQYPPP